VDALILDFDGVVVDSEPIHLACFRQVLAPAGIELGEQAYYRDYLGFDDHDCFQAVLRDHGLDADERRIADMTAAKTVLVQRAMATSVRALPGSVGIIRSAAAAGLPVAVCSGALRDEIELASATIGVREHFATIVAGKDVKLGKPDPEGYVLAIRRLAEVTGRTIRPERCVVVEDSPAGIQAARDAGTNVLALTTSYAAERLGQAQRIVATLADVALDDLLALAAG
jgi:beta-phosphoglucomutase